MLEIVAFADAHLDDAAQLAAARYRALRLEAPLAPARYEEAGVLLPLLREMAAAAPGVAALRDGRLIGYLLAWMTPSYRGQRTVYSPEWANGAEPADGRRIYEAMYAALAGRWAVERYFDHYVTVLAHDRDAITAWQWMGFGYVVADGIRDLEPCYAPSTSCAANVTIRRAASADLPDALPLWLALHRHLAAAPIFLVDAIEPRPAEFEAWLADPANALWLAYRDRAATACLGIGPANHDACTIIRDPGTASIYSAFTRPDARGDGVATALLDAALAWARAEGYVRCAVDFETANIPASRFWLRHFQPVCLSLGRRVNFPV